MNRSKGEASNDNHLEMKEATGAAWKSYMAYENAYTKNMLSFEDGLKQTGLEPYIEGLKTESAKFTNAVTELIKGKNIDKDLVNALNRRLENESSSLKKALAFYDDMKAFSSRTGDARKIKEDFVNQQLQWNLYYKGAYERAVNDIQEIARVLSERYGQTFTLNDFLVIQQMPQRMKTNDSMITVWQNMEVDSEGNIINDKNLEKQGKQDEAVSNKEIKATDISGTWNANGDALSLSNNGRMTWVLSTGQKASGSWKMENGKLHMDAVIASNNQKIFWLFNLSEVTGNSFTMTLDAKPYNRYHFVRIQVN